MTDAASLDAARQLLPWWAVWGPVLFTLPAVFLASFLLTGLALLWPLWGFWGQAGKHWTERARRAYPAAQVLQSCPSLLALAAGLAAWLCASRLLPIPVPLYVSLAAALAFLGSSLAGHLTSMSVLPGRVRFSDWPRLLLAFVALNGWAIVVAVVVVWMPAEMDAYGWGVFAAGAVGVFFFATGQGLWLARLAGLIYPAPERLRLAVGRTAARLGRPVPPVFVFGLPEVNAYAALIQGWLMFTREADAAFTDEELEAVSAHELAHLSEPPLLVLARLLPTLSVLPFMAVWPVYNSFGLWGIGAVLVLYFAASWLSGILSRHLERVADEAGKGQEGDEGAYARALEKMHESNLVPAVFLGSGETHPHLYDRLLAAGMEPAYERPPPPSHWPTSLTLPLVFLLALALAFAPAFLLLSQEVPNRKMAFYGPEAHELAQLANLAMQQKRFEDAAALYAAAGWCDQYSANYPFSESLAWARARQPERAAAAREEYVRRAAKGPPQLPGWLKDLLGPDAKAVRDAVFRLGGR